MPRRWRLEALDRRVRRPEDLIVTAGVPVIGVLRPAGSSRPVFRRLLMVGHAPDASAGAGGAAGSPLVTGVVSTLGSPPRATRTLGAILVDSGQLTAEEAERVLAYQRTHNLRFGEAAVRLGLISEAEVQFALSRQFAYAYLRKVPGEARGLSDEIVAAYQPFSSRVEQLRAIRSQLMLRWFDRAEERQVLTIVGAERGEGRTYLAANLAVVFAQLGERTLLIDADMRTPRQHSAVLAREPDGLLDHARRAPARGGDRPHSRPRRPVGAARRADAAESARAAQPAQFRGVHDRRARPVRRRSSSTRRR